MTFFSLLSQHMPSDIKLQLSWIHNVAEMRLQQAEQDPSPSKMDPMVSLLERFGEQVACDKNRPISEHSYLLQTAMPLRAFWRQTTL